MWFRSVIVFSSWFFVLCCNNILLFVVTCRNFQLYHKLVSSLRNAISSPSGDLKSQSGLCPWALLGGLTPQTPQLPVDLLSPLRGLRQFSLNFLKFEKSIITFMILMGSYLEDRYFRPVAGPQYTMYTANKCWGITIFLAFTVQ